MEKNKKKYKVTIEFKPIVIYVDDEDIIDKRDACDYACESLNPHEVEVETTFAEIVE